MAEDPGGRDHGRDDHRDLGDGPAPAWRDEAPDPLAPIDPNAPVSGHVPVWDDSPMASEAPEHDWALAADRVYPVLLPAEASGMQLGDLDGPSLAALGLRSYLTPLVDPGPVDLQVKYVIAEERFDVTVNGEHLIGWGIPAAALRDAAFANLARWAAAAAWSEESSGDRRLISSSTGGWDASRILLPDERARLAAELGGLGRVLIGLPERHLLVAGALRPGDDEFAGLLAAFVAEQSDGADEPVDPRLLELVGGEVVPYQ
jgi:hypothetical protein